MHLLEHPFASITLNGHRRYKRSSSEFHVDISGLSAMPLFDHRSGPSYGTINQMEQHSDDEGEQLLPEQYESGSCSNNNGDIASISEDSVQEGVRKIEAINMTWTTRSLIIAYIRFVSSRSCRRRRIILTFRIAFSSCRFVLP